jgi:hypothetical protein
MCHPSPTLAFYKKHKTQGYEYRPRLLQPKKLECAFLALWFGERNLCAEGRKSPWALQYFYKKHNYITGK